MSIVSFRLLFVRLVCRVEPGEQTAVTSEDRNGTDLPRAHEAARHLPGQPRPARSPAWAGAAARPSTRAPASSSYSQSVRQTVNPEAERLQIVIADRRDLRVVVVTITPSPLLIPQSLSGHTR